MSYVNGLFYNPPSKNAPKFVKGSLSFRKGEFLEWLDKQDEHKGYVRADMLVSKKGGIYFKLNDWKPEDNSF